MDVNLSYTVKRLIDRVYENTNLPSGVQLYCCGKEMCPSSKLLDYNILKGSAVKIIFSLCGGAEKQDHSLKRGFKCLRVKMGKPYIITSINNVLDLPVLNTSTGSIFSIGFLA